jgi:adenosylcobyric acid synthase
LKNLPGVRLVWARTPADCNGANWIILPGSKHTTADLTWLREQGLDQTVVAHANQGKPVLGICGGLQMLGEALVDTHGIDGNAPGLGLLPLVTHFEKEKTVRRAALRFENVQGLWAALAQQQVNGYEIHHGRTVQHPALAQAGQLAREVLPALGWQNTVGNVLGVYVHGLFEDPAILNALFGALINTPDHAFEFTNC